MWPRLRLQQLHEGDYSFEICDVDSDGPRTVRVDVRVMVRVVRIRLGSGYF